MMVREMNKRIKTPVIRFLGFSDNWKQSTFGDLAGKFEYGLNASATKYDGENKYIRITDIDDVTHKFLSDNVTSPDADLLSADNFLLNDGDILFARTGASVGKSYQYDNRDGKLYFAGFLIRARISSDNDTNFVFQNTLTSKYKKFVKITSQRSGQPGINAQEFRMFKIMVPDIEEQIKIGEIFKQIDNLIVLQQQLLNNHKQLKKAMLQKMFPQKGESVPRIRFAGFTGNWKKHKLGNYLTIPEKNEKKVTNLDELITLKLNLLGMYSGSNRATLELGSTKYYERKAGQFLYGKQNFFNGSMGIIPAELDGKATSGDVPAFDINDINRDYIFTYVSRPSYWKSKESQSSGTGSKRIHEKVLQTFDINVPSSEEQTKIGNFFKQLDETIVLNEKKLETYQNLKKAMLQKMFV